MANYQDGLDFSGYANADLDTKQYYFAIITGSNGNNFGVSVATGASGPAPTGILQNDPRSGAEATLRVTGISKLYADTKGTAIAVGDFLTSGSDGAGIANTNGSSVAALAVSPLSSGCGYISALLLPFASGNKVDNTP